MKKLLLLLLLSLGFVGSANAMTFCPDGSWVSGSICSLCPNGQYVGGRTCKLAPDGRYIAGSSNQTNIGTSGWDVMTKAAGDSGASIGKALGNTYSGENVAKDAIDKMYKELMNPANYADLKFKPPVRYSGKWEEVLSVGNFTIYKDPNTILSGKDGVFWWELWNLSKADERGRLSYLTYKQVDCKSERYKRLTYGVFNKQMARGQLYELLRQPDEDWTYPKSGYVDFATLAHICVLTAKKQRDDSKINLNCIPDEYPKKGTNDDFNHAVYANYVSKYHEIENDGDNGLILLNISYDAFKDKRVEFEKNKANELPITFYHDKSFSVNGKLPHFNDGLYKEDADFVLFVMYSKGRFERWDYRLNRRTGELIESVSFLSDESNNNYAHSIPRSYQCVRAEGLF